MAADEELVARVAGGDAAALEMLVARYEHALASFVHRRTGGRDVDDLYQETWLRVVRAAPSFDTGRRFSTWLFQIATNLCRDWWRRRPEEAAGDAGERVPDPRSTGDPTDALVVESLLARLPDAQREALVLRYYHDASEAEMSEILGCPRGTVKSRIHNALTRLAELVSEGADVARVRASAAGTEATRPLGTKRTSEERS